MLSMSLRRTGRCRRCTRAGAPCSDLRFDPRDGPRKRRGWYSAENIRGLSGDGPVSPGLHRSCKEAAPDAVEACHRCQAARVRGRPFPSPCVRRASRMLHRTARSHAGCSRSGVIAINNAAPSDPHDRLSESPVYAAMHRNMRACAAPLRDAERHSGFPTNSANVFFARSGISVCATMPVGTVSSVITPYSSGQTFAGGRLKVPISMSTTGRWMA